MMRRIEIFPGKLQGIVRVPASKSLAHRAIICAALAGGTSELNGLLTESDDIHATLQAVEALGATVHREEGLLRIQGVRQGADAMEWGGKFGLRASEDASERPQSCCIDCNESGSTLRFMLPVALTLTGASRFVGKGNLGKRPMEPYFETFKQQEVEFIQRGIDPNRPEYTLDLTVSGRLQSGVFRLPGNVSSQFISGLLFALPMLKEDSWIELTTPLESRGYLEMTLAVLADFGIRIQPIGDSQFLIPGRQRYQSRTYTIEGDFSQAAFFLSAGALGSDVTVAGLNLDSLQGDREVMSILQQMGAQISQTPEGIKARQGTSGLHGEVIDGSQCPDIVPILSAVAVLSKDASEIINAGRLRLKECDRLEAVRVELNRLGARITERKDGLMIQGVDVLPGGAEVSSHGDHRIAMTLAIAATCCRQPIVLDDPDCVAKSYPDFWKDYQKLGGRITDIG